MATGWFRESYRHQLAANGVRMRVPKNAYYASKGGYGGALLGAAHDLGSEKSSIQMAGELGKETLTPIERAGEATEPAAYSEGQDIVPDVRSGGEKSVDDAFALGGNMFEKQYMAKKGYTAETAPYYDQAPGLTPNEVYAFEERTGRKHKGESWGEYFKRESTDEVDENATPDIVTLPESRKALPLFAKKNPKVQALSPGARVIAVPALLGAWSGESGAAWLDRKVKK